MLSDVFRGLRIEGYFILNKYYDESEIEIINSLLPDIYSKYDNFVNDGELLERVPGSVKVKHIENYFKLFKRYSADFFYLLVSFIFNGSFRRPSTLLSISHDGSLNSKFIPGKCTKNIGYEPHIDSPTHYLKILCGLSDVKLENGPTCIYAGTHRKTDFYSHFYNKYLAVGNLSGGVLSESDVATKCDSSKIKPLNLNKGDIAFIDTRCVHYAAVLKSGFRKIMWLYC